MQWNFFEQCRHLLRVGFNIRINRRMNRSRRDIVDRDIEGGQFQADGAGHHAYSPFGATVRSIFGHRDVFVNRRNVDDTPGRFAFDHLAGSRLRAEKGAFQVNSDHTIELLFSVIQE